MRTRLCAVAGLFILTALSTARQNLPIVLAPSRAWKLAFVRHGDVWTAHGDGTGQKRIIRNGYSPCWSPDRAHIAFVRNGNVWVANADGSGQRKLTFRWTQDEPTSGDDLDTDLAWDPRADRIIFSHWEKYRVSKVGDGPPGALLGSSILEVPWRPQPPRRPNVLYDLFDAGAGYHFSNYNHPVWSASGKWLAFTCNGDIWIAERHGLQRSWGDHRKWEMDVTRLAAVAQVDAATDRGSRENYGVTHLSWSPDEKTIVYGIRRLGGSGYWEVRSIRVGSDANQSYRLVTKDMRTLADDGVDPSVSPDGKFIAYFGNMNGTSLSDILVISADGKFKKRLIEDGEQPVW